MLDIETERSKLEADVRLREIDLKLKQEAMTDKANSEDMKNIVNAVDKMAKAQS